MKIPKIVYVLLPLLILLIFFLVGCAVICSPLILIGYLYNRYMTYKEKKEGLHNSKTKQTGNIPSPMDLIKKHGLRSN